jgi:hypothetical protein
MVADQMSGAPRLLPYGQKTVVYFWNGGTRGVHISNPTSGPVSPPAGDVTGLFGTSRKSILCSYRASLASRDDRLREMYLELIDINPQ